MPKYVPIEADDTMRPHDRGEPPTFTDFGRLLPDVELELGEDEFAPWVIGPVL